MTDVASGAARLNLRRAAGNFASATAMRLATAVLSFAFFVYLARAWGSEAVGRFSTAYAYFLLLQQIPLLGLHVALMRDLAQRPEAIRRLAVNALLIGLATAVVVGLLLAGAAVLWYPPAMRAPLWLVALSLIPCAVVVTAETVLTARERLGMVAAVNVGEGLGRTVVWLALLSAGFGITALFVALLVGRVATVLFYLRSGTLADLTHIGERSGATVRALLAQSPTYLGILLLAGGIQRLDFLFLGKLADFREVGLYSAPYKVYEVALMVPSVLSVVLFPAVSRAAHDSPHRLEGLVRQLCRFCVSAGLPCAVALAFLARPLVGGLFGAEFAPAAGVLVILAFVPVVAAADQALTMVLLATGRQQLDLTVLVVACGVYAAALVLLIPPFGYLGAAAATTLTALVQLVMRGLALRRTMRIGALASLAVGPAAAAAAMAAVTAAVLVRLPLPLALAFGGLSYVAALGLVRAVTPADLRALRGALLTPRGEVTP